MAYKALYRTYRPNGFQDVAGQKHIVRTLQNAVTQNKIAHAYLFCGPRGTGKTSIAKIFAKAVNCTGEGSVPCLTCENCKAITAGTHPDIIEIDAASNNGVEEVRSLIERVKYAPIEGKYKVYIIDEVHMMSTGAFNALLKTIEEPPAHVIFILATTEPHKVLPTIISRCQRYDFTKVSDTEIVEYIKKVLGLEKIACSDEAIRVIAQLSDGGMRDALSILDQCIAYAQDKIEAHHVNEIYGIATVEEKIAILETIQHKDAGKLLDSIESLITKGTDLKRLTTDLLNILKETVIYDYTKDESLLKILNLEEVRRLKKDNSTDNRLSMIDLLMDTFDKYRNAASVQSYLEVCLLKMMNIASDVEVVENNIQKVVPIQKIIPTNEKNEKEEAKPVVLEEKVDKIDSQSTLQEENVSRETIDHDIEDVEEAFEPQMTMVMEMVPEEEPVVQSTGEKQATPLKDELILQLLVGANKAEKQKVNDALATIDTYLYEIAWAKQANLIKGSQNIASGEQYVILGVDNQATANEINAQDKNNEFTAFTKELFKQDKKIFAITMEQSKNVIQQFKERMQENTLPAALYFDRKESLQHVEEQREKTPEEAVLDLFGQENVIIKE